MQMDSPGNGVKRIFHPGSYWFLLIRNNMMQPLSALFLLSWSSFEWTNIFFKNVKNPEKLKLPLTVCQGLRSLKLLKVSKYVSFRTLKQDQCAILAWITATFPAVVSQCQQIPTKVRRPCASRSRIQVQVHWSITANNQQSSSHMLISTQN